MSKLYQQQQQQGQGQGANQSGKLSPGSHSYHTHRLHSPKASSFLPKPKNDKKLHRRVLSGGSLKDDYFSVNKKSHSGDGSPSSIPEGTTARSPGVALPTFQKIENYTPPLDEQQQQNVTAGAIAASQQGDNGSRSTHVSPNLSSSKIYDRRKAREKDFQDDADRNFREEFMSSTDLVDKDMEDPEVEKQYQEKLEKLKEEKAKRKKNVEFYNSDSGSDVDINSDNENSSSPGKEAKLSKADRTNTGSSSTSSGSSEENKTKKRLKSVFKKLVQPEDYPSDSESDHDNEKNSPPDEGGFFSKFINLSGGGLAPGAAKAEPEKQDDEEAQHKIVSDEGVEMSTLDPELFAQEASGIAGAHAGSRNNRSKKPDTADETTLKDNASVHSHQGSFLAPNPDLYLRDEEGIFEMNLDDSGAGYVPPPERVRGGVLSSLLKMYQNPQEASKSSQSLLSRSTGGSPLNSGATTPTEIDGDHNKLEHKTLAGRLKNLGKRQVAIDDNNLTAQQNMIQNQRNASSAELSDSTTAGKGSSSYIKSMKNNISNPHLPSFEKTRPKIKKAGNTLMKVKKEQAQARITVHIADILQRQRFVLRMCKALMLYGAPTHRLEEYLTMTARVLEIDGQFIYFPGCMIVSFGDATTRTSEVQLVRCPQGLNLYKLHRVHRIYKQVIHDLVGVEEASNDLDELLSTKPAFPPWLCVIIYGFSSAMVTPFAFGGGWVNLPVSFLIGLCVGSLQFLIAPRSNLYSNVFEVTASIVVAFIGRALGSINGSHICFSAVVQGSLALILPGYIILCGSLELQSRNLVAGAVRMFYAIIYSLFLGFGITLGAALYGWIDDNATSETTCSESISPWFRFLFVPCFTIGLCLINQAKWFQLPIMLFISCAGYVVNYFASKHFQNSTEFTAAMGAFVIGVLGNLYSRIWKGLAVSAMLPAIFVQVPSGIASQASLLSGVQSANQLTSNSSSSSSTSTSSLSFGVTMVEVAIGISVGLFASTIFVYPFGKKSTSIFTL